MRLEIHIEPSDNFDDLTFASEVIETCEKHAVLNVVKVARAILLEMVGDDK